jgi:predicted dehydrogenase
LLEITGTEATLVLPDPNTFAGELQIRRPGREEKLETLETTTELSSRGTGVLDMARALRAGRPHRAQGALAYHVLDIMVSISESIVAGEFVNVDSSVEIAQTLPPDWDPKTATL